MAAILGHGRPQDFLLIFVSESMILRGNVGQGVVYVRKLLINMNPYKDNPFSVLLFFFFG